MRPRDTGTLLARGLFKTDNKMTGQTDISTKPTMESQDSDNIPLLKDPVKAEEDRKERRRIMKNVILLSIAFFLNFNSYTGLSRLQSSLNGSMGIIAMSLIHVTRIPSCLILPNIVIGFLRHKWSMALGFLIYMLWMATNTYATWGTLAPASVLVGMGSSFTWTAVSSYLTISATKYAKLSGESQSAVLSYFFGIFYSMRNLSGMTGSALSSAILQQPKSEITQAALELCGVNDCPWNNVTINPNEEHPDNTTIYELVGIFLAIAFFAVLIVTIFVDSLPKAPKTQESTCEKAGNLLIGTAKHLMHKKQLVLIPVTVYLGMSQASFTAEFTKSYITCALGIWKVGLVTMAFAIVNSAVCLITGRIVKYTGRQPICAVAFIVDIMVLITLLTWQPHPDQEYVFYIVSALWGVKEAILLTQINAIYGSTFSQLTGAAYASYRLFESVGYVLAYNYSSFVCTSVKLYILGGASGLAIISYFTVENWNRIFKSKSSYEPL